MALGPREVQNEAGRTSGANVLLVNQAQLIRDTYLEAFSGGNNDGFSRALIDVLASACLAGHNHDNPFTFVIFRYTSVVVGSVARE